MKLARPAALGLVSAWIVACATAQDSSVPGDGSGATSAGASTSAAGASGAFSAGGSLGVAGSNGAFGGSGAAPGSSGSTGVAGHGGSVNIAGSAGLGSGGSSAGGAGASTGGAAAGGAAGKGGANSGGGTGGSAPVFEAGVCAANPTMSLSYEQSNTGQQITGQYQFANLSDTPIAVASLKIRYFFSNEHTKGWDNHIYDAKLEGGTGGYRALTATLAEAPISPALDGADTYAEVSFSATASIEKGATATVSWDMQPIGYDAPFQVQANDYSFNAADTDFTPWDHVAIYQGDTLVFGCLPKALGGGTGGAGGSGGASNSAGASGAAAGGAAGAGGSATGGGGGAAAGAGGVGGVSGAAAGGSGGSAAAGTGGVAGSGGTAG